MGNSANGVTGNSNAAVPNGKKQSDSIKIGPEEHGMFSGRPAPSHIRDLVNDIELWYEFRPDDKASPEMQAFKRELHHGEISVNTVEALGESLAKKGSFGKARRCYELLAALADWEPFDRTQVKSWKDRDSTLGPKEYTEELSEFDHELNANKPSIALSHLSAANKVRISDSAVAERYPWIVISKRLDLVQVRMPFTSQHQFLYSAFEMAR